MSFQTQLAAFLVRHPERTEAATLFADFFESHGDVFERHHPPGHFTASCWLVTSGEGEPSPRVPNPRITALSATNDGFELAEVDLELRGEGTIMGERQTGRNDLKLASLRRDKEWVVRAREAAFSLVDADPHLENHPLLADELRLFFDEDDVDYLFKS